MAETEALIGYGSEFRLGDGASPEVFTPVAEVNNITPPSDTVDVIDATHMASPNRTREFIEGLIDPGEASFEMNFVPGGPGDEAIQEWKATGGRRNCQIKFGNTNVIWTFAGILTGYEPDVPTDDKMTATVTIKVTGSYVSGVES
ncbi:hypothetical protein GCM10007908_03710 [Rhizobium albus]|nr:hypothetical protein GCM10007908_03710 [Rhizobium albus]